MARAALTLSIVSALALAAGVVPPGQAWAQKVIAKDGRELPDWSGVWQMVGNTVFDQATKNPPNGVAGLPGTKEAVPYNAEWQKKYEANMARVAVDRFPDPVTTCSTPSGWPRDLNTPDTNEFVVRPEQSWILTENGPNVVRIYTDGRPHLSPDEIWPTYSGDSVGHWEGDTLVFDTIGVKGWPSQIIDRTGAISSDKLHTVTRMRKVDAKTIEADMTLDDPEAFTKPWHVVKRFRKLPDGTRAFDYVCAENQRNVVTPSGKTLTLDTSGKPIDKETN
jgi:hypothetical protein